VQLIKIGGQTLQEMSEQQLKNLLPEFKNKPEIETEIIRILQTKSKIRHSDARNKHKADEDFTSNNF
jgi:hypothetical protein